MTAPGRATPRRLLLLLALALAAVLPGCAAEVPLARVQRGARVIAIGAPRYFVKPVARGRVTGILRNVRIPDLPKLNQLITTSAHVRHGFSGGPLADARGRVIGITMAITGPMGGMAGGGSLSIPIAVVVSAAQELGLRLPAATATP